MDFMNQATIKDIFLLLFLVIIIRSIASIFHLQKELEIAKKGQITPFLDLEINSEEIGLFIVNNSNCYAKNIRIEDVDFVANVGFKKHLKLVFEPIDALKVSQREKLKFKVFDNNSDITDTKSKNLINYFKGSDTKVNIRYSNIENTEFIASLEIRNNSFQIKDVRPFSEDTKNIKEH